MLKDIVDELVPKLIGLLDDKDLTVKDATIHTLGILKGTLSKEASQIQAVNTINKKDRKIYLDSTDGIGFVEDLNRKAPVKSP